MSAPAIFEDLREEIEDRLVGYIIRKLPRSGFRVVRRCKTGETHHGFFLTHEAAIEHLMIRLRLEKPR